MASNMSKKRKTHPQYLPEVRRNEDLDELFLFGYACKMFRDDTKAEEINSGQHLIPWMGNQKILIDRYDGRGHLYDLTPYDADLGHQSVFSEEELRIEALCDEERYLELHTDVMEKAAYEEEELKRLNEALADNSYGAVAFNYDQPMTEETTEENQEEEEEDDEEEPFVCPEELKNLITEKLMMPETTKLNAIMEKTALFVSQHGPQMEIVIKTKQKDNENFCFLDMDHSLNPYYKKLVSLMKSGKYRPKPPEIKPRKGTRTSSHQESDDDEDDDDDDEHGCYLHPSLMAKPKNDSNRQEVVSPSRYQLSSDQVQDTAYAKLMNKISLLDSGRNSPQNSVRSTDSPVPSGGDSDPVTIAQEGQPAPPGTEATVLPVQMRNEMAQNGSYQAGGVPSSNIIPPPPDLQPIIDKMAEYVARNGADFETTVRNKQDIRFQFLNEGHVFYAYYMFKKAIFEKERAQSKLLKEKEKEQEEAESQEASHTGVVATVPECSDSSVGVALEDDRSQGSLDGGTKISVSFSIKVKEPETVTIEKRPAFIDESSDEEGNELKEHLHVEKPEDVPREKSVTPSYPDLDAEELDTLKLEEKVTSSIEDLDKKQAEHKIKDRLAMAAREKLAQTSKEKQMQAARKRKAAMFINMLKSSGVKLEDEKDVVAAPTSGTTSPVPAFFHSRSQSPFSASTSIRRSPSNSPEVEKHKKHKESKKSKKSPKKSRRHRSRSPRRRKSRTPPSSYAVVRRSRTRSRSPRQRDRSKSKERSEKLGRISKSRSRSKERSQHRKSKSPSRDRKSSGKSHSPTKRRRSRSRSKSRRIPSGSRSRRERSRSREKSRKHRSRSRSKEKSKSKSERKSSRKKSRSKSPKSKESKHKSEKKHRSKSPKSRQSRSKSPKTEKRKSSLTSPSRSSPKRPKLESVVAVTSLDSNIEPPQPDDNSPVVRARSSSESSSTSSRSSSPMSPLVPISSPLRSPSVAMSVSAQSQLSSSRSSTPATSSQKTMIYASTSLEGEIDTCKVDESSHKEESSKSSGIDAKSTETSGVTKTILDTKLSMEDIEKMRAMIKAKKEVLKEEAIFDI